MSMLSAILYPKPMPQLPRHMVSVRHRVADRDEIDHSAGERFQARRDKTYARIIEAVRGGAETIKQISKSVPTSRSTAFTHIKDAINNGDAYELERGKSLELRYRLTEKGAAK